MEEVFNSQFTIYNLQFLALKGTIIWRAKFSQFLALFHERVDIQGQTELVREVRFGQLADGKSDAGLFDFHTHTQSKPG